MLEILVPKVINRIPDSFVSIFTLIVSPTRRYIKLKKRGSKYTRRDELIHWSWNCLEIEIIICVFLSMQIFEITGSTFWGKISTSFLLYFSISRIFEILTAFAQDIQDKISNIMPTSALTKLDRIRMLWFSFFGLSVHFSVMYWYISLYQIDAFSKSIPTFLDLFYYSVITIATVGYGDITPASPLTKSIAMIEIMMGYSFVIMAVSVYLSSATTKKTKK